ncbi:hypothetical protein CHLRE_01g044900v5 [Chlamydomonas reinhardtii]|uniref:PhoD-like phosphatase domain-containing protein n=1 Tax=Chlamydomonas reinhardtii TaxID=3055 RepID=A0A2K3E7N6_CHLRE|nr:uncharacterized protein CHLRE_01g044900v5 [Chlamydomonas reinhardtii]XP_042928779.1 uncharacterized protein CHLRE_01g044900v5 [Chlamydomonas reinhardtii]PNW88794.1 hypothetical protein CHLRE_01g044900v5 [Chlamydomonas reinhardtii]PNW88795.1 hypothetical protein CHLRE_01g044900v5 [Chlamydomonas reinhardtii]
MGCSSSNAAKSTALPTAAGNGSGRLTAGAPGASSSGTPPANAVLPYYTLASLGGRQVFGPFIKLVSYDADSGEYQLTALVVCSSAAQSSILGGSVPPQLVWGEVPGSGAGEAWKHTYTAGAAGDYAVPAGATNTEEAFAVAGSAVGERLAVWRDWQFWRFKLNTTCGADPKQLKYKVDLVPGRAFTVSVPALSEAWHAAFYSCNGLHNPQDYGRTHGIQPLWVDLMRQHSYRPYHVLLGGGDQLYNDGLFEGPLLKGWDQAQDDSESAALAAQPFTEALRAEMEEYYFSHYASHFGTQPIYTDVLATIPSVNTWDDHDIVDGWGSYPPLIQNAPIMQGLFAASKYFYLLFQHHTTQERLAADGYWCDSSSQLVQLGASTALVVPDQRTFRTQHNCLPPGYLERLGSELRSLPASTRHVVVMLAGPILYPSLPVQATLQKLDNVATGSDLLSVVMQKTGLASKITKRFGMVFILDDIIDQWSASQHVGEKAALLRLLVSVADEKQMRFSVLSGDVHCAGYGMFHSRPADVKPDDAEEVPLPPADTRIADAGFIPQIISSAIANIPPPGPLLKSLCVCGRKPEAVPHYQELVQRMFPLFGPANDVDSLLLGRRNWCDVVCGASGGSLDFTLRAECEMGGEEVNVFTIRVPPLLRFWQQQ